MTAFLVVGWCFAWTLFWAATSWIARYLALKEQSASSRDDLLTGHGWALFLALFSAASLIGSIITYILVRM